MKKFILLCCTAALFASCKSYQISTISSTNAPKNDSTGVFNVENDSLIISYSFLGNNAPVNVEIFNKLNEPVIINWQRSALIVADKAYSYVDDNLKITGETAASTYSLYNNNLLYKDMNYSTGTINATVKLSKDESFLPPHSKTSRTIFVLNKLGIDNIDKSAFKKKMLDDADGINKVFTKTAEFSAENSPLKFKSYVTISTLKNNQPQFFNYQHDFFISTVTKVNLDPKNIDDYKSYPGNVIVTSKTNGLGKTLTGVAIAGGVVGLAAVDKSTKK